MRRVVVGESATGWVWWLQADLPTGCEVLVRGVSAYSDESACRKAAQLFGRGEPGIVLSVQDDDGGWRLRFHDAAGDPIALSADRFADARASRLELDRMTHAIHPGRASSGKLSHC